MKFKLKVKDNYREYIEEFNSNSLFLIVGSRRPIRVPFKLKSNTKEEFERFGLALIDNYNKYCHPNDKREFMEVIL